MYYNHQRRRMNCLRCARDTRSVTGYCVDCDGFKHSIRHEAENTAVLRNTEETDRAGYDCGADAELAEWLQDEMDSMIN